MRWIWAARCAVVALAIGCAVFVAVARYPIGLDFQGGAHLVFAPAHAAEPDLVDARALTRVRETLADLGYAGATVIGRGTTVVVEVDDLDDANSERIVAALTAPGPLGLHELAADDRGRRVRGSGPAGETLVVAEPAAIDASAIEQVTVSTHGGPPQVELTFTPDGARALSALTARTIGRRLALVIGDELIMAPTVDGRIDGGALAISDPGGDPTRLARRLRAALVPPLALEVRSVIGSTRPHWQGVPLAIGLAVAAGVLWLVAIALRRRALAIAGTFALAWVVAVVDLLRIGATFTLPLHATGVILGLPAAAAVWLASRAAADHPRARLGAVWPALAALGLVFVVSTMLAHGSRPGPSLLGFGIKFAAHPTPVIAVVAALAAISTPRARS